DVLSEVAKTALPPVGPLNLSASIASKGETLEAKRIKIDLTDEKIQATVAGSVGDLLKFKEVNADIDLRIESLDVLSEVAKTELPPLDPLNLSANIVSRGETFEAKEIKLDLAGEKIQVKIAASVRDLMTVAGINADVDINVDSLASLDAIVKQKLPKSGPVALEGNISSEGLKSPVKITTVIKSDGVKANLNGSIADIPAADGIDMTFTVEADSMQKVGRLSGLQLQGREPLKLEGRFTAAQKAYQLAGLHLQAGKLKVDGKAAFKPASEAGGRPQLSAEINVGALDLSKRQKQKQKDSSEESEPSSTSNETEAGQQESDVKERLFPGEPLPFESLRAVDVDVDITVARLTTLQVQLEDLAVGLTLDNGLLGLAPIQAKVGNGTFSGEAVLDARNTPAALSVDLHLADATFRDFGGNLDLLVDLDGKGDSVAAIMAGLNGVLEVDIQDATLKKSIMTSFGSDLLSHLNPFDKDEDKIELICAIALFNISDGMADAKHKIAAQMTDVTWFGGGEIDLKTEEIGFHFKPKARKGLGISLGSLASLVSVGGTLADPKIRLNLKDVAVKYGKYLAASATGGLSLVADLLWSKVKANTDVCAAILEHLETEEEAEQEHKE
ncbi:MAG: AsmA family protein, partial [Thermodesulfobacteriota bacterium]